MSKQYKVYLQSPIIVEANTFNEAAAIAEKLAHTIGVEEAYDESLGQ